MVISVALQPGIPLSMRFQVMAPVLSLLLFLLMMKIRHE